VSKKRRNTAIIPLKKIISDSGKIIPIYFIKASVEAYPNMLRVMNKDPYIFFDIMKSNKNL
tara:strand:+ start:149 stop:331 length:183 start_codon:yes stop_codon:yes gene_type:complete